MKMNVFLQETIYFCHLLKNRANSNYENYLENNILNESSKVAVRIKTNINYIYRVF